MDFEIKVPKKFSLTITTHNGGSHTYIENIDGIHEISNANGKITMKDVSGSVVADAINGNITVNFKKIYENATMMFTSINGNIDITFPENLKANILAGSVMGSIFTDFEIQQSNKDSQNVITKKNNTYKVDTGMSSGIINGGGADITFKTYNGNIFIRSIRH